MLDTALKLTVWDCISITNTIVVVVYNNNSNNNKIKVTNSKHHQWIDWNLLQMRQSMIIVYISYLHITLLPTYGIYNNNLLLETLNLT